MPKRAVVPKREGCTYDNTHPADPKPALIEQFCWRSEIVGASTYHQLMAPRTREQLLEYFAEQIEFLKRSNATFDQGHINEAKRMANPLRILFHHTADKPRGRQHALLNQLGLENTLTWVETAGRPNPRNLVPALGLVQQKIDIGSGEASYCAKLDDYPQGRMLTTIILPRGSRVYFEMWWTHPVVKDAAGALYSRKDFVLALANQEGGAHVDPEIQESYDKIANFNSLGWSFSQGPQGKQLISAPIPVGPGASRASSEASSPPPLPEPQEGGTDPIPMPNPVPYMVRQISHEVVKSVQAQRDRIK